MGATTRRELAGLGGDSSVPRDAAATPAQGEGGRPGKAREQRRSARSSRAARVPCASQQLLNCGGGNSGGGRRSLPAEPVTWHRCTSPPTAPGAGARAPRRHAQVQGGQHPGSPAPSAHEQPLRRPPASQFTQTWTAVAAAAFTKQPPRSPRPPGAPPLGRGLLGNVVPAGPLRACVRAPPEPGELPLPATSRRRLLPRGLLFLEQTSGADRKPRPSGNGELPAPGRECQGRRDSGVPSDRRSWGRLEGSSFLLSASVFGLCFPPSLCVRSRRAAGHTVTGRRSPGESSLRKCSRSPFLAGAVSAARGVTATCGNCLGRLKGKRREAVRSSPPRGAAQARPRGSPTYAVRMPGLGAGAAQ